MTTANKISIFRILLVPFFIVLVLYYADTGEETYRLLAILCFGVASISDGVDGYLARRYHQQTELGAILDPLADKLLLASGIVLLSFNHHPHLPRFPLWLAATVVGRDMILLIGLAVARYLHSKLTVRPLLVGKTATVLQMTCVLWGLLKWPANWLLYWSVGAAVCTGVAGLCYVFDGVRQVSASPSSTPTPRP